MWSPWNFNVALLVSRSLQCGGEAGSDFLSVCLSVWMLPCMRDLTPGKWFGHS